MTIGQKPLWTRIIELVWIGLGLIAVVAGTQTWRDAILDKHAVEALPGYHKDGPRGVLLRASERTAFCRLVLQLCFVGVGVVAVLVPRPIRTVTQRSTLLTSVVFIALEALLTWDAVMERRDRRTINRLLDRRRHSREARPAVPGKGA